MQCSVRECAFILLSSFGDKSTAGTAGLFLRGKEAESMKGIALPASTFNDKRSLGTQQANVVLF